MQLAEAVKRRLSPANFEPDKDLYVALAIAESIRAWMKELKSQYHGNANLTAMYAQSDGCAQGTVQEHDALPVDLGAV